MIRIRKQNSFKRQKGSFLVEVVIGLIIISLGAVAMIKMISSDAENVKAKATAARMTEVVTAVINYVRARYQNIDQAITANGGNPITINMTGGTCSGLTPSIQACGYVTPSFRNINSYNQTHDVGIRRTASGILEVIIGTEGGFPIPDNILPRIASRVGDKGVNGGYILSTAPTSVQGAYGNFTIANVGATFPGITSTGGHLVANLGFETGSLLNDYLYRVEIPGHPEANQMFTDLHLDGGGTPHDINGIKTLTAQDGVFSDNLDVTNKATFGADVDVNGKTESDDFIISSMNNQNVSKGVYYAGIHENNDTVTKPTCPLGMNPQIFAVPSMFSDSGTGGSLSAVQTTATNVNATTWRVRLRVRTEAGWTYPSAAYAKIMVITKCN